MSLMKRKKKKGAFGVLILRTYYVNATYFKTVLVLIECSLVDILIAVIVQEKNLLIT